MLFRREKREMPLLNTTSTADISFMLLILFLVTTSMDIDKGLSRQLPPAEAAEEQPANVREGLVLKLRVDGNNALTCNDEAITLSELPQRMAAHVEQHGKEHIIQLQTDRQASYDTYFQVQNMLVNTYRQLRDQEARSRYHRPYAQCSEAEQESLRKEIPQRISEVYQPEEGGTP